MTRTRIAFYGLSVLALTFFVGSQASAQQKEDKKEKHDHKHDHGHQHGEHAHQHGEKGEHSHEGEMDEHMAAWMKYAAPGEHHQHLKPLAGNWNLDVKYRHSPDEEWQTSNATSEVRWILGGRFLHEEVTGEEFMGQIFQGVGIYGYDNYAKKYTSIWMDSMSTMTMASTGSCDASGKVLTYEGAYDDPFTGSKKKIKSTTRIINENKHVMESVDHTADGKEFKNMEIVYTRR